jgi:hypothetical protein
MKPMKPEIDDTMSFFPDYDPAKEQAEKKKEQEKQDKKNEDNQKLSAEVNEILLKQVYYKNEPSKVSEPKPPVIKRLTQEEYETKLLRSQVFRQNEERIRKINTTIKPTLKPELLSINLTEIMATAQDKLQAMIPEEQDKKNKENWEIFKEAFEIKNVELFKKAIEIEKAKNIPKKEIKKNRNIPKNWITVENLEKDYEQSKYYESFFTRDGYKPNKCVGCSKYYSPISPCNPFSINPEALHEPIAKQVAVSPQVSCTKCGSKSDFKYGKRIKKGKGSIVSIQKYQCLKCASYFQFSN